MDQSSALSTADRPFQLQKLPIELQEMVVACLAEGGEEATPELLNWSSTCRQYRARLAPLAFRFMKLQNNRKSGNAVRRIAAGPLSAHVEVLRFRGRFPWDLGSGLDGEGNLLAVEKLLPTVVHVLLAHLDAFPNLHTVSVRFDADHELKWAERGKRLGERLDPHRALQFAVILAFREAMENVFGAVAANVGLVKHFEILELITMPLPVFTERPFRDFLGVLQSFKLSLVGTEPLSVNHDLDPPWNSFDYVVGRLESLFLSHLTSLTTLRYQGGPTSPSGIPAYIMGHIDWQARQMPWLQAIHLDAVALTEELLHLVRSHRHTLQSIEPHHAYCDQHIMDADGTTRLTWAVFLDRTRAAGMPALRHLDVQPETVPLTNADPTIVSLPLLANDPAEVVAALQAVQADPRRRMFAYEIETYDWPYVMDDHFANLEAFKRGDDQRAWDQLTDILRQRA